MKVQTPLRLEQELIDQIKEKAKAQKRSFNNYIEYLLYRDVGNIPNEETIKAIEDARNDRDLIHVENLKDVLEKL